MRCSPATSPAIGTGRAAACRRAPKTICACCSPIGPSFRLLIAHGYSDMITPYAMTRYMLDHLPAFDPPGRVQLKLYRGGHMLYLDPESRKAFTADAAAFYRSGE